MSKKMDEQQKYIDIIAQIDNSFARMKRIRPLSTSEVNYYLREFSISASHNSNAIEGNTFTFDETKLLIEKGIVTGAHSLRESEDIIGYKNAFDFLYKALKEEMPVTEDLIKKIHSFVLRGDEEAGKYRLIQNYVGNINRIVYTPCPPSKVAEKMNEYIDAVQKDFEKNKRVIKEENIDWYALFHTLAKHHIEFENIHPFIDGNGRTGRLLLIYEMISLGLLPVDIRYEERERYYAAIGSYRDKKKYSTRPESKTEKMAKLLAESELESMKAWLNIFVENNSEDISSEPNISM